MILNGLGKLGSFFGWWHEVLNLYWLLDCQIWPVRLQNNVCIHTGQLRQFGPETTN